MPIRHHLRPFARATTALAITSLVACGGTKHDASSPEGNSGLIGKSAPELHVQTVRGSGPSSLSDARGKVTIVDFWATYCEPCRRSFPHYQDLAEAGVNVIAVSVDDPEDISPEDIAAFADELNVTFPIVWDKEQTTAGKYHPPKMPTSYIIDANGIVRHIHAGFEAGDETLISEQLKTAQTTAPNPTLAHEDTRLGGNLL